MASPSVSFRSDATSTTTTTSWLGRSPSSPLRQPSRLLSSGSMGMSGGALLSSGGSSFGMGSSVRALLGRAAERRTSVQSSSP